VLFGEHLPLPSQFAASVATSFEQLAARHGFAADGYVHVAVVVPLQVPLQAVPSATHAARGDTGGPATGEHVPFVAGRLQASHCPEQALSQQTPSTHRPEAHCPEFAQALPSGRSVGHVMVGVPAQTPDAHVSLTVQD
jgi:hypothetical protein